MKLVTITDWLIGLSLAASLGFALGLTVGIYRVVKIKWRQRRVK